MSHQTILILSLIAGAIIGAFASDVVCSLVSVANRPLYRVGGAIVGFLVAYAIAK